MAVNLVWVTPDAEKLIGYMARVSNSNANQDDDASRLIGYLLRNKHWSPFEMASLCVSIETTRDIARQILRHRSFHFQEFSQRYAEVMRDPIYSEARLQDTVNRQNSIRVDDQKLQDFWTQTQLKVWDFCYFWYQGALKMGIAKELARKLLPEGLVPTHMYMAGTIRDWIHYLDVRTGNGTQLEHQIVARDIQAIFQQHLPGVAEACNQAGLIVSTSEG